MTPSPVRRHQGRKRALVVDDEALIRWSVAEVLSDGRYDVVEAGTAQEAVDVSKPFSVVMLDIRLPDSNSLSLLMKLHHLLPTARIIVMSAHGTPEIAQRAYELGASSVMPKPFEIGTISALTGGASLAS